MTAVYLGTSSINVRPGPPQCFNCQQYGHSSAFCHLLPLCVRCSDEHRGNCPGPRAAPAKCCNCSGSHPANYRGCDSFRTAKAKKRENDRPVVSPSCSTACSVGDSFPSQRNICGYSCSFGYSSIPTQNCRRRHGCCGRSHNPTASCVAHTENGTARKAPLQKGKQTLRPTAHRD